ncbi:hypothetical protein HHI36_017297 [Cryptolaemus montrouzieri]|uniref:Ubiquitin-protein ligase E3A N-terminal zinc-binding domain-containing protein n=1 Tax=Cryptolaemus montrouzieri TaxID=559131 RepID=A0ABD2NMD9_9CUCU
MNSSGSTKKQDEASRNDREASSSNLNNDKFFDKREDEMKRAAAKKLIERYFYQLTDGCGNPHCDNKYCASSGNLKPLTPDEAAAQAIQLFSQDARLCERHPNKIARTQDGPDIESSLNRKKENSKTPTNDFVLSQSSNEESKSLNLLNTTSGYLYLTEQILYDIIDECEANDSYSKLIRTLGKFLVILSV